MKFWFHLANLKARPESIKWLLHKFLCQKNKVQKYLQEYKDLSKKIKLISVIKSEITRNAKNHDKTIRNKKKKINKSKVSEK